MVSPPVYLDPVYLDNAASTATRPEAVEAMLPLLTESYGNPSGAHRMARDARRQIDDARDIFAAGLGCEPGEVVFTAGGTEADNLAVLGVHAHRGGTVVCSAVEHPAVLVPTQQLNGRIAPVDSMGMLDLAALADLLDDSVSLVSVMLANNETGVIQPLEEVADVVHEHAPNALIHTDAVQAFPWLDVAALAAPADLISIASHKFGGPKGAGVLAVRGEARVAPQMIGGGQERDIRSGTHNAPAIVGMAVAAASTLTDLKTNGTRVGALRDRLADGLIAAIEGTTESAMDGRAADRSHKVPGSCHLCFEGIESEALLFLLEREDILASAASSCSSGAQDPSHVLAAMGYSRELAAGSLRLSLGYASSETDVDRALAVIPDAVDHLRRLGS
ncbi:MAG: cysteine desulfurase family protein [Acidimicrobiales bacterium]